jgi:galactokinase
MLMDAAHFRDHGFEPDDAASRAALMQVAVDVFRRGRSGAPAWAWFVPGRIEVFGKHTDYAGGRSLVAAVPRGFAIVAAPTDDGIVHVEDARYGGHVAIAVESDADRSVDLNGPNGERREARGWHRYVAVVARRLARNFPGARLGAHIVIASDLPRAAGVSSSSALVVGLATALIERGELERRPEWRGLDRLEALAGYLGAVENGLTFGPLASASGVGTHGGSEDHTAILACQPGMLSAFAYVPVVPQGDAPMPPDWRFIVITTGIEADKAGSARDRYNRASLSTRALVDVWARRHPGDHTLATVLAGGSSALVALRQAVAEDQQLDFTADELSRRLSHFVAEDRRVAEALVAVRDGDAGRIGELSADSQTDAERWLGNQIPETSALVRIVRESGAFAATSFGAGFGGSVWALVERTEATRIAERAADRYRAEHSNAGKVEWFSCRPGPGRVRLS